MTLHHRILAVVAIFAQLNLVFCLVGSTQRPWMYVFGVVVFTFKDHTAKRAIRFVFQKKKQVRVAQV